MTHAAATPRDYAADRVPGDRREAGQTVAAVLKARLGLTWSQAKRLVERHTSGTPAR